MHCAFAEETVPSTKDIALKTTNSFTKNLPTRIISSNKLDNKLDSKTIDELLAMAFQPISNGVEGENIQLIELERYLEPHKTQFTALQNDKFEYLVGINLFYKNSFERAKKSLIITKQSKDIETRFYANLAIVRLSAIYHDYDSLLVSIDDLLAEFDQVTSIDLKNSALNVIANFYQNIGEDELALTFLSLRNNSQTNAIDLCLYHSQKFQIDINIFPNQVDSQGFKRVIDECSDVNQHLAILYTVGEYSTHLINNSDAQGAIDLLTQYFKQVESLNQTTLDIIFHSNLAKANYQIGHYAKAKYFSDEAINTPINIVTNRWMLSVYDILSKLSYDQGDKTGALSYLKMYHQNMLSQAQLSSRENIARAQIKHANIGQQKQKLQMANLLNEKVNTRIQNYGENHHYQHLIQIDSYIYGSLILIILLLVALIFYVRHLQVISGLKKQLDPITKLNNRTRTMDLFSSIIYKAQKQHSLVSMVIIDIDHFRAINKKYGIKTGDMLLYKTAQMIEELASSGCCIGRIGANEFAVIYNQKTKHKIEQLSDDIRKQSKLIASSLLIKETDFNVSIGFTDSSTSNLTLKSLLTDSSLALRCAKSSKTQKVVNFDKSMQLKSKDIIDKSSLKYVYE